MCTLLDGKSLRLLELNIQLFEALRSEARRLDLKIDTSEIMQTIGEAQALVITPVHPTKVNRRDNPTESYQNPTYGSVNSTKT